MTFLCLLGDSYLCRELLFIVARWWLSLGGRVHVLWSLCPVCLCGFLGRCGYRGLFRFGLCRCFDRGGNGVSHFIWWKLVVEWKSWGHRWVEEVLSFGGLGAVVRAQRFRVLRGSVARCTCFHAILLHLAICLAARVMRSRSLYASTRAIFNSGSSVGSDTNCWRREARPSMRKIT